MAGTRKVTRSKTKKEFQDLEFQDAFMFAAVLEDEELCRKMLERILDFPIEKVVVQSERSLFVNSDFHGIRMDVYARDEARTVYNVDYSDFRFIPINSFKACFHKIFPQVYRNNYF